MSSRTTLVTATAGPSEVVVFSACATGVLEHEDAKRRVKPFSSRAMRRIVWCRFSGIIPAHSEFADADRRRCRNVQRETVNGPSPTAIYHPGGIFETINR